MVYHFVGIRCCGMQQHWTDRYMGTAGTNSVVSYTPLSIRHVSGIKYEICLCVYLHAKSLFLCMR